MEVRGLIDAAYKERDAAEAEARSSYQLLGAMQQQLSHEKELRDKAETEVRDLALLPIKMSEQARRMWQMTNGADDLKVGMCNRL